MKPWEHPWVDASADAEQAPEAAAPWLQAWSDEEEVADFTAAPEPANERGALSVLGERVGQRWKGAAGGLMQALGESDPLGGLRDAGREELTPDERAAVEAVRGEYGPSPVGGDPLDIKPWLRDTGKQWAGEAKERLEQADMQYPSADGSLGYYASHAGEALLGQVLPAFAVSIASKSPTAGLIVMFPQVYGEKYGTARAEGRTAEQANQDAGVYAASETLTEVGPFNLALKAGVPLWKRFLQTAGMEGAGEVVNSAVQRAYDEGFINDHSTLGDFFGALVSEEALRDYRDSFVVGAMVGGGLSVPGHYAEKYNARREAQAQAQREAAEREAASRLDAAGSVGDALDAAAALAAVQPEVDPAGWGSIDGPYAPSTGFEVNRPQLDQGVSFDNSGLPGATAADLAQMQADPSIDVGEAAALPADASGDNAMQAAMRDALAQAELKPGQDFNTQTGEVYDYEALYPEEAYPQDYGPEDREGLDILVEAQELGIDPVEVEQWMADLGGEVSAYELWSELRRRIEEASYGRRQQRQQPADERPAVSQDVGSGEQRSAESPATAPDAPGQSQDGPGALAPEVDPGALAQLPDEALVMLAESGEMVDLPLARFTPQEQSLLRAAGLVRELESEPDPDTGERMRYEGVLVDALWKERDRRLALDREGRKNADAGEGDGPSQAGRDRRAEFYERMAQEQDALGELGDAAKAQDYREKAAKIRAGESIKAPDALEMAQASPPAPPDSQTPNAETDNAPTDGALSFVPTHVLPDGTEVVGAGEANVWVDASGAEIEDENAQPIAQAPAVEPVGKAQAEPAPETGTEPAAATAKDRPLREVLAEALAGPGDSIWVSLRKEGADNATLSQALAAYFGAEGRSGDGWRGSGGRKAAINKGTPQFHVGDVHLVGGDLVKAARRVLKIPQGNQAAQPPSPSAPADYEARVADRLRRAEQAPDEAGVEALLAEEYADEERHFEGTKRVERAVDAARERIDPGREERERQAANRAAMEREDATIAKIRAASTVEAVDAILAEYQADKKASGQGRIKSVAGGRRATLTLDGKSDAQWIELLEAIQAGGNKALATLLPNNEERYALKSRGLAVLGIPRVDGGLRGFDGLSQKGQERLESLKKRQAAASVAAKETPAGTLSPDARAWAQGQAWERKHPDYRTTTDSPNHPAILLYRDGGTTVVPVSLLSDEELLDALGMEAKAVESAAGKARLDGVRGSVTDSRQAAVTGKFSPVGELGDRGERFTLDQSRLRKRKKQREADIRAKIDWRREELARDERHYEALRKEGVAALTDADLALAQTQEEALEALRGALLLKENHITYGRSELKALEALLREEFPEAAPEATGRESVGEDGEFVDSVDGYLDKMLTNKDATVRIEHVVTGHISPELADLLLEDWRETARSQASSNGDKTILSLFDRTGVWSAPYVEAGYNVIQLDIENGIDINDLGIQWFADNGIDDVHGILAACPCTDFASSGARWWAAKDADGRTDKSVELVAQVLRTVEYFRPAFWAIENPVGRIRDLTGLPTPRLIFQPHHFGDPYTKKTLLYGNFNTNLPTANVWPTEGSKVHKLSSSAKHEREQTPEGFAYAFFMANGGVSNAVEKKPSAEEDAAFREWFADYQRLTRERVPAAVQKLLTEKGQDQWAHFVTATSNRGRIKFTEAEKTDIAQAMVDHLAGVADAGRADLPHFYRIVMPSIKASLDQQKDRGLVRRNALKEARGGSDSAAPAEKPPRQSEPDNSDLSGVDIPIENTLDSGETVTTLVPADEALAEADGRIAAYRQLLACMGA